MKLGELLDRVNLPDLIARECGGDAVRGLSRERGGVIRDPRPGHRETHPSFSVYLGGGRWRWKRHGGGDADRGDALAFLETVGYSPEHAREQLARLAGVTLDGWQGDRHRPSYQAPDPLREARVALERCAPLSEEELGRAAALLAPLRPQDGAGRDLQRRGLSGWPGLQAGRLRRDFTTRDGRTLAHEGALGLLIPGPDNTPWGLKVRNLGTAEELRAAGLDRYVYRIGRHGAPAWCSPRYGSGDGVPIVEGELNGASAARALEAVGSTLDVQGLAGAGGAPFLHGLHGKLVFLHADPDAAGASCLERVGQVALASGAREVRVLAAFSEGDFCDLCGELGPAVFGGLLMERVYSADYWQPAITGKNGVLESNAVPHGKKDYWQTGNHVSGWGDADASGWGTGAGGWGGNDRGGW